MASENEENFGRRTRSGRTVSTTVQPAVAAPHRSTRRTSKKQVQEKLTDQNAPEIIIEDQLEAMHQQEKIDNADIITEMLVEAAAQGVHIDAGGVYDANELVEEIVEDVQQYEECIVYAEQPVNDDGQDVELYHEEQLTATEGPVASDDKSSSFPFGAVGQSETSDEVQNEEEEEASAEINESGAAESSLLASLAGDNANSLPSVGGGEELDSSNKRDDFEAKVVDNIQRQIVVELDDSISEPAIAEDLVGVDGSDDTIVNMEMVSEDELPLPTKPEINDAEEVSDDELPAPQRAELPADAEVISEDELPANSLADKKTTSQDTTKNPPISNNPSKHKRKAEDIEEHGDGLSGNGEKLNSPAEITCKKNDEQYNPMSPTSESNDAPPVEKKCKLECNSTSNNATESELSDRKRDKERAEHREKDGGDRSEKEREKDKEKERDRDKEKERKKLPDLDKYWRAVRDDSADFTAWTYLLHYVDNESDAEAAREAYDEFLSHYPYCYGYWRKYADYEKRKGVKSNCNAVFQRGLEAIPLSVDLWIHYLTHVRNNHSDNEGYVRSQFERAIDACGLEFRSDKLWDAYIKWESEMKHYQRVVKIYDRLLAIPTQGYNTHFDSFQDLINQHSITSTINSEELRKVCSELLETNRSSSSSHAHDSRGSKSPTHRKEGSSGGTEIMPVAGDPPTPTDNTTDATSAVDVGEMTPAPDIPNQLTDISTLTEEEIAVIKDKVISVRRKLHKNTVSAVTARWGFEEGIKRPYFHVKPLERCQLKNWNDYLEFEIGKGDRKRILVLFERCLIACALYDEFWLKMIRYLETQLNQPDMIALTSDVFRRACQIHHPDKPSLHLMWAAFEECQGNFDGAAAILTNLEKKCPNLLQVAYRRINVERRRGDLVKCRELYEHYISNAKNKSIAGNLAIKYARFLNKICDDLHGGLNVLRQILEKDAANTRVALQMIDMALQRPQVDEFEVVQIMDNFMARENMDPDQKVLFAQRKVEFLEDFGSTAKGLQEAQRALQIALNKANEYKKKRDNSPSKKSTGAANSKDSNVNVTNPMAAQSTYNNGSTNNANYNYGSTNSPAYYGQQNSGGGSYQQQTYDGYYNHWQYGSGYSGYGQWSGYGNYY